MIDNIKRYVQIQNEFLWLTKANVALATYNITAPVSPLLLHEIHSLFKLFFSDVGLLTSRYPKQASLVGGIARWRRGVRELSLRRGAV
jgi:hypothetical protein